MPQFEVRATLVVCCLLSAAATPSTAAGQDDDPHLPPNIRVPLLLVPVFEELLSASPTFAAQCARLADAKYVRVVVTPVMASSVTGRGTARTTMRRYSTGALLAAVDMPVPLTIEAYAELFGHEFEHIIEQIDRVDLKAQTRARQGATRLSNGDYETARARRAGRAIAAEALRRPRPRRRPP